MPGIQKRDIEEEMNKSTQTETSFVDIDDSMMVLEREIQSQTFPIKPSGENDQQDNKDEILNLLNENEEKQPENDSNMILDNNELRFGSEKMIKTEKSVEKFEEPKIEDQVLINQDLQTTHNNSKENVKNATTNKFQKDYDLYLDTIQSKFFLQKPFLNLANQLIRDNFYFKFIEILTCGFEPTILNKLMEFRNT